MPFCSQCGNQVAAADVYPRLRSEGIPLVAAFTPRTMRASALATELAADAFVVKPYRQDALANHPWKTWADWGGAGGEAPKRMPGGQSRWSQGKDLSWEPLRPELVVEVAYEHMQGTRFRHMAQFRRWRTDKMPGSCTYAQLEVVPPQELMEIFAGNR